MLTERDLFESHQVEKASSESFLRGIVDFLKWTSTIAAAATIWIVSLSGSVSGSARSLVAASVITVLVSLIVAVLTVRRVLSAWAAGWQLAIKDSRYVLLKKLEAVEPSKVTQQQVTDAIDEYLQAIDATRRYSTPNQYWVWATLHVGLLVLGLILYVIGQTLATF